MISKEEEIMSRSREGVGKDKKSNKRKGDER
jgi:hypothetical protein